MSRLQDIKWQAHHETYVRSALDPHTISQSPMDPLVFHITPVTLTMQQRVEIDDWLTARHALQYLKTDILDVIYTLRFTDPVLAMDFKLRFL